MDRRDFLKATAAAGVGLALGLTNGKTSLLPVDASSSALAAENPTLPADLAAVRNGEPGDMFDAGIAALGGMKRFVKPGQTVVLKPNVSWESSPQLSGNTNPDLIARIIRRCREAGASRVTVVDHTIENGRRCYELSGIGEASRLEGATVAPAEAERYYQSQRVDGKSLQQAAVHEAILEADVFINIPVLKHHGGAGMTAAIKNLMGAVWDRRHYHANDLHQCIADFLNVRRPDLNVVDCYRILTQHGPRGGATADVKMPKMQLLSTDIVAVDIAAARLLERDPARHIQLAHEAGHGQIDPTKLRAQRITL